MVLFLGIKCQNLKTVALIFLNKYDKGLIGGARKYSPFWGRDSCRNGYHPEDGDLLNVGDLQGMVTVPGLLIVQEMGIVLGRASI